MKTQNKLLSIQNLILVISLPIFYLFYLSPQNSVSFMNTMQINVNVHYLLYGMIVFTTILNIITGFKNFKINKKIAIVEWLISVIYIVFTIQGIRNNFNAGNLISVKKILKQSYVLIIGVLSLMVLIFNRKNEKGIGKKMVLFYVCDIYNWNYKYISSTTTYKIICNREM